jgi:hypothetical protein
VGRILKVISDNLLEINNKESSTNQFSISKLLQHPHNLVIVLTQAIKRFKSIWTGIKIIKKNSAEGNTAMNPSSAALYFGSVYGTNKEKISSPVRKSAGIEYLCLAKSSQLEISINGNIKETIRNNASVSLTSNPTFTFQ